MNLHNSPDVFSELIQTTAESYSIPEVYVEKDYWVTKALKRLAESDYAGSVVFKGGTALSKAHGLIRRFSEDIEAVRCEGLSQSQIKALLKNTETTMSVDFAKTKKIMLENQSMEKYEKPSMRTQPNEVMKASDRSLTI